MENMVFLLGGKDLEMQEIARMLEGKGIEAYDRQLDWAGAKLSAYEDVLEKYRDTPYIIYGVELQEDKWMKVPDNYRVIDHHNEYSSRKSSLEQVAAVLGVKLSRHQQLVAANDSAYLDGLREMGATPLEIQEIRRLDRQAQGVTEEEEQDAMQAINEAKKYSHLWVVRSRHSRFSPICDRIDNVADDETDTEGVQNYLIYTDKEWVFYGYARDYVKDFLLYGLYADTEEDEGKNAENAKRKEDLYSGGTSHGYLGRKMGSLSREEMEKEIEAVVGSMEGVVYSTHIFSFPFTWENEELEKWEHDIDSPLWKQCKNSRFWERNDTIMETATDESHDLYDEANFFYKFTHPVMYDMPISGNVPCSSHIHILHMERKETKEHACTYCIRVERNRYELKLKHINLNFYRTGVGMLSFYLENDVYAAFDDILAINQYGRRIFPPFWDDINNGRRCQLADEIAITGLRDADRVSETFRNYTPQDTWKPASFIEDLIHDFHPDIRITPAVDDRMFVACWYQNGHLSNMLANGADYRQSAEWFRYVFVDTSSPSCQDAGMMMELLDQSTNPRWRKYGTMYGITRYSFMVLTDIGDFGMKKIRKDVNTIYARMVELALMQRAMVLKISGDVGAVNIWTDWQKRDTQQKLQEKIESIYRNYVFFVNQMYHRHITAQEQGTELYDTLHRQLDLERQVKGLDEEIGELHNYISVINDQVSKKIDSNLNTMAGIFLPASIITGLFGMNQFEQSGWLCVFLKETLVVLVLTVAVIYIFQRIGWTQIPFRRYYEQLKSSFKKK